MAGDSFGRLFRVHNWGESHGKGLGVMVEGCPSGIPLKETDFETDMARRRPGQSFLTTQRTEEDAVSILSGVFAGKTTGAPLLLMIHNKDSRPSDYRLIKNLYRPSHADFVYEKKYGIRDPYGGGRSSARTLAGNVAAGVIAKKILWRRQQHQKKVSITAYVHSVGEVVCTVPMDSITARKVEQNAVRCPDKAAANQMIHLIEEAKQKGDSLGGVIGCIIKNCPIGLGEPLYDKLEADLGKACLSVNACKGFEVGSGFAGTKMTGSQHNDLFVMQHQKIATTTNHSGGIQGGISNGMDIVFRAAFKPTSTLMKEQKTLHDRSHKTVRYRPSRGRHDPCVLPRAVVIIEAMASLVLCDHYLRQQVYVRLPSSPH